MLKTSLRIPALTAVLCLVILSLASCSQPVPTETPETSDLVEVTPSATEDFVPVVPKNADEVVILSFEEDAYAHLFAYIPGQLPLTRLTTGDWDDITPAPSPNGERIIFTSN